MKKATETVREEEKKINYRRNFSDPKSPCFRLGFLNRETTKGVIGDFLRPKRDYARSKGKIVENPEDSLYKEGRQDTVAQEKTSHSTLQKIDGAEGPSSDSEAFDDDIDSEDPSFEEPLTDQSSDKF